MASFDFSKTASILTNSPNPVLDAMGTQFGVPQCMMDFAKDVLSSFPSPILNSINSGIGEGKALADSVFKDVMRKVFLDTGIVEYDTTLGRFVFVSSSSNMGVEDSALDALNDLAGLGTILGFGAQAWVIGENIGEQIDLIKNCVDKMKTFSALQKGPSAVADKLAGFDMLDANGNVIESFPAPPPVLEAASKVFDQNKATLEQAAGFVANAEKQQQAIQDILQARAADPKNNPEPVFWKNMVDPNDPSRTLGEALGDTTSFTLVDAQAGPDGFPIVPPSVSGDAFNPFVDVINASGMLPPVSKDGQYLFSKTGIYYDSYGGGLDYSGCITNIVNAIYYDDEGNPIPGTGVPEQSLEYLFKYNPNLGGKGQEVSWATFNKWANTAFDIEHIDESPTMQEFYNDDHFLQVLVDQRNREIYDTSNYISELQTQGYSEDSAVLTNQRQILYSKISTHDAKIKKRKKQIQVHVILAPESNPAVQGQIPINNFQDLDSGLLAIEKSKQEHLIFNPGEVSGVVLPLCPEYIKSEIPQDAFTVEELMVPPVGVGQIITSDFPVDGTSGTILSLTDEVSTKNLVAIYNFLDADIVKPDSTKYLSINCNTSAATEMATQLVASSIPSMFPSGIGVPYFRGVCNFFSGTDGNSKAHLYPENYRYQHSAYRPYGYGRIQSGYSDIESLLYNNTGASFDFWTHIPDLDEVNGEGWAADQSLSALHRVVLGCENRGGSNTTQTDSWTVGPTFGSNVIRGLLMGFTRDRRITKGIAPSNQPDDNKIGEGLVFHMSPTQSINTSGVTFLAASADAGYCVQDGVPPSGYYGIAVDTSTATAGGHRFNDSSSMFVHTAVTVDYGADAVSIYLNGELLTSQTVAATFGAAGAPQIPSMTDTSSFAYDVPYKGELPPNAPLFPPNSLGFRDFWYWDGPIPEGSANNMSLTPWIIGGGYTDGMHPDGLGGLSLVNNTSSEGMNFMGGKWGGKKSGLHGFIGSLKLYNRALSAAEALQNYNAQKGFFTTIRTYPY
jgi:hypothetical protein